ncbi:DUF599 domain-containing protein [Hartmannibacter diazotrophicus]|uniref:DUF599 domain-containing protein n=1 Tax=Hartmannibacter diazotrophicus TaxID=1482074 RepID=UPI000C148CDC|nr:DUF599 family protein [Hartmannibacter diazotrophicus]
MSSLQSFSTIDLIAGVWFAGIWLFFSLVVEGARFGSHSLSSNMNRQRAEWIRRAAARDLRMIDTSIISGLQNGTAFFASTSLLALGGCFALLNSTDRVIEVVRDLPLPINVSQQNWEVKVMGLLLMYAYAFFKFGWAYRLFNYCSILVGALPPKELVGSEEMQQAIDRAATFNILAGRHFNRGLRAFFLSIGYLGWFAGGTSLIVTSTLVLVVLLRRQYFSRAAKALRS